ncbi:hypothetical protein LEN26_007674 [Aphanomyces euteiches]|nr:hypothetical protein LEN26_007674 [Aphanomyces euteiches]
MSGPPPAKAPLPNASQAPANVARLTSLRSTEAAPRKVKFMPRAPKRAGEEPKPKTEISKPTFTPRPARSAEGEGRENRMDGGRSSGGRSSGGRQGGPLGGRGRFNMPAPKVVFGGGGAQGASVSSIGGGGVVTAKPKQPSNAPAVEVGISVLEDALESGVRIQEEEPMQWPPPIQSAMQPMELPFGRPPTSNHTNDDAGSLFCDESGEFILPNDTVLFVQLPTTLPYTKPSKDAKTNTTDEATATERSQDDLFDKSLHAMPGGFMGKINIHKSGKAVLVLGDKTFNIAPGHPPTFYEEAVSIDTKEELLSMLGPVSHHLVVTPDFEALLR